MLTSLWLGTGIGSYKKNCTIHLSCTCNHVFDIVSMSRTVNVSVMTGFRLILNMTCINGDTALLFFGSIVNILVAHHLTAHLGCTIHCNSSSQGSLTVINVADSTDINMRLRPLEFLFSHKILLRLHGYMNRQYDCRCLPDGIKRR